MRYKGGDKRRGKEERKAGGKMEKGKKEKEG